MLLITSALYGGAILSQLTSPFSRYAPFDSSIRILANWVPTFGGDIKGGCGVKAFSFEVSGIYNWLLNNWLIEWCRGGGC